MISIIVPVYHVEDYISECLDSLINQTYKDIEIICINDCTLDNSVTLIKEYMKKDARIKLVNHEENRGLGGARNTGIKESRGDYILFVDSDDYLDITMTEKLYTSIIQSQSDASVCGVMLADATNNTFKPHTAFHYNELAAQSVYSIEKDSDKEILTNMWPSAWNKLFKASIIKQYHILFKEKILYEDHTFFYEYFSHCKHFSYINEPLYFYRQQRPHSITTHSTGREKEIFTILQYISEIFKNMYPEVSSEKLLAKITVRLLYERRWVFDNTDPNYYTYLQSVSEFLNKWNKNFLLSNKDTFIETSDPIFFSIEEIKQLEKANLKSINSRPNFFKANIKKIPPIKNVISTKNSIKTIKGDFYWFLNTIHNKLSILAEDTKCKLEELSRVSWDTHNKLDALSELSLKIDDIHASLNRMVAIQKAQSEQLSAQEIISQLSSLTTCLNKCRIEIDSCNTQVSSLSSSYKGAQFEERLSDIENSFISYKKKLDDIWWLSWNIKDHITKKAPEGAPDNDSFLRYYPTWIPNEYPEYFKGNTWYWSDNFKKYYIEQKGNCEVEQLNLYKNLSEKDIQLLKLLWERNIYMIPYSRYTDKQGYLIKRDLFFTSEELDEQEKICRSFSNISQNYILPSDTVYEIPVFYYEHGLKTMSDSLLSYIRHGDILDLGGFIGDSALVLNKYTDGNVFSVEMNGDNIEKMKYILNVNHVKDNVKIIYGAVGSIDGTQTFYGNSSYSTLAEMEHIPLYDPHSNITVHKVDTLVVEYNIKPHLMKLDVEGAEYNTIMGAKETICKYHPVLCISIYHTAKDFLFIKPLIESWNLGYRFHIENHNPFDPVYEKMLICIPHKFSN